MAILWTSCELPRYRRKPVVSKAKQPQTRPNADWWARIPAYVAIVVSGLSFWFTYESGLPSLAAKAEFMQPIVAGENFNFKLEIDNNGNTTAKHIHPDLRIELAPASFELKPFGPAALSINTRTPEWRPTVSDLGPKGHTTIYSVTSMNFANDESIKALIAGKYRFYVYGKFRMTMFFM